MVCNIVCSQFDTNLASITWTPVITAGTSDEQMTKLRKTQFPDCVTCYISLKHFASPGEKITFSIYKKWIQTYLPQMFLTKIYFPCLPFGFNFLWLGFFFEGLNPLFATFMIPFFIRKCQLFLVIKLWLKQLTAIQLFRHIFE